MIELKNYPDVINGNVRHRIEHDAHPLANNPVYPPNKEDKKYLELVAEGRYKELIDRIAYSQEVDDVSKVQLGNIGPYIGQLCMNLYQMEQPNKQQLQQLAETIVRNEFNIDNDEIRFKFTEPSNDGCLPEDMELTNDDEEEDEELDEETKKEINKRHFINTLIQGSAKKSHSMFLLYKDELDDINPQLYNICKTLNVYNDLIYYMMDEKEMTLMMETTGDTGSMPSYNRIEFDDDDVPVVILSSPLFNGYIHEMIKGIMEIFAFHALPEDPDTERLVYEKCDTVENEFWGLRFGPTFWTKLNIGIPEDYQDIKKLIIPRLFMLETDEFNQTMQNILSDDNSYLIELGETIREEIKKYEENE